MRFRGTLTWLQVRDQAARILALEMIDYIDKPDLYSVNPIAVDITYIQYRARKLQNSTQPIVECIVKHT